MKTLQKKKVLLLCASHNDLGLIKALRKLGAYIITIGNIPNLCGQKYADEYVQLDYSDKDAVLALAKEKGIDSICQCCNDFVGGCKSGGSGKRVCKKLNTAIY